MPDVRSKVRALHHWVASNIRYIAVSIEDGGFVPRSAEQVLANLYGDCKDHVVLLEALFELSLAVLAMFLQLFEIRLDAMVKKGTVNKKYLADLPKLPAGTVVIYPTVAQQTKAREVLAKQWGKLN
jgi:hypothetical protein